MPDNPAPLNTYEKTPDFFKPIQLNLHAADSPMGRKETYQSAICGQEQSSSSLGGSTDGNLARSRHGGETWHVHRLPIVLRSSRRRNGFFSNNR